MRCPSPTAALDDSWPFDGSAGAGASSDKRIEDRTDISALLPSGTRTVTQPAPGQFTVKVEWLQPGPNPTAHNFTTTARINGG